MLDQDFCEFLEYEICKAFKYSDNDQIKGFWCDGVLLNQADLVYSQKPATIDKEIKLKAFIGKDGQSEYELTLKLGSKASNHIARNLGIKACFPKIDNQNWFAIDIKKKKMEIQLD